MQLVESVEPPGGSTTVLGPSLALDLSWAIHAVWKLPLQTAQPTLGTLYREHPELAEEVRGFWDDGLGCYPELEVLATWAGALEVVDLQTLLPTLSSAVGRVPP